MKTDYRNHLIEGTRAELLVALGELRDGAVHNGSQKLAEEAAYGLSQLMTGATSVRVGVMAYDVTDTTEGRTLS